MHFTQQSRPAAVSLFRALIDHPSGWAARPAAASPGFRPLAEQRAMSSGRRERRAPERLEAGPATQQWTTAAGTREVQGTLHRPRPPGQGRQQQRGRRRRNAGPSAETGHDEPAFPRAPPSKRYRYRDGAAVTQHAPPFMPRLLQRLKRSHDEHCRKMAGGRVWRAFVQIAPRVDPRSRYGYSQRLSKPRLSAYGSICVLLSGVAAALTRATMTNHKQISRCTSTQLVTHRHARQLAIHAQRHLHGDVRINHSAQRRFAVRLCSRVVAPSCDAEALSLLLPVLCGGGRTQRICLGGGADAVFLPRLFRVRQRVTNVGT